MPGPVTATRVTQQRRTGRDLFPRTNSPGQASVQWVTHEALVEYAPGFSGARTRLQRCGWGWTTPGGVLKPWASSDFLGKSWQSSAENSGNSGFFASSDGIVRECGVM